MKQIYCWDAQSSWGVKLKNEPQTYLGFESKICTSLEVGSSQLASTFQQAAQTAKQRGERTILAMPRAENVDRPLLQGSGGSEKDNCSHSSINYRRNTPRHPRLEHNEYWRVSANTCMHAPLLLLFLSLIHRESGKELGKGLSENI